MENFITQTQVTGRHAFLRKTYMHLFGAILGFISFQFVMFTTGLAWPIARLFTSSWILVLGGFMLLGWFARSAVESRDRNTQYLALSVYVMGQGLMFVPLLAIAQQVAGPGTIMYAGIVTLVGFTALTGYVLTNKADFSFLGATLRWTGICAMILIGLSLLFRFQLGILFSVAMVAFAGAAILFDTSRILVLIGFVVLISVLILHSLFHQIPIWLSPFLASAITWFGIRKAVRYHVISETYTEINEVLFLAPIFGIVSMIEGLGGFELIQEWMIAISWPEEVLALLMMFSSSVLSGFADNIAIMDFLSRAIQGTPAQDFYAISIIYGTALGGFFSPIASVQAIILFSIISKIQKITFFGWIKQIALLYAILLVGGGIIMLFFHALGAY